MEQNLFENPVLLKLAIFLIYEASGHFVTFHEQGVERHFCDIPDGCFSKVWTDNL